MEKKEACRKDLIKEMEKVSCPVCNSNDFKKLFKAKNVIYHLPGVFDIVKCRNCGLIMTNPRPTKQEIGKYYPDNYGPYKMAYKNTDNSKKAISKKGELLRLLKKLYRAFMQSNSTKIPKFSKPGKVFELGCGVGNELKELKDAGWEAEGVEMDRVCVDYANRNDLNVECGRLEDFDFGENRYDLITAFFVLEHVHNPIDVLKKLRRMIKDSGYFVFSIPNLDSWEFSFFKGNWQALDPPLHLFHYKKSVIKKILDLCGFKLKRIHHQKNITSLIRSIAYLIEDKIGRETKLSLYLRRFPQNNLRDKILSVIFQCFAIFFSVLHQSARLTIWAIPE